MPLCASLDGFTLHAATRAAAHHAAARQALLRYVLRPPIVHEWIRANSAYAGVIDFEAAVRDPEAPSKVLASFDSGDHLHPNDAGHEAMATAVPLSIFK